MKALNRLTSQSKCFIVSFSSEVAFSRKRLEGWAAAAWVSSSWLLIGGSLESLTGEVMDLAQLVDTDMFFDNCTPDSISTSIATVL